MKNHAIIGIIVIFLKQIIRSDALNTRRHFLLDVGRNHLAAIAAVQSYKKPVQANTQGKYDTSAVSSTRPPLNDAISGIISGAVVSSVKVLLLHPIDTVKTRLQTKDYNQALFRNVYSGLIPPLLIGAPSGALFFGVKDFVKEWIQIYLGADSSQLATCCAVFLAQFPYWAVRTPTEILKNRIQTESSDASAWHQVKSVFSQNGIWGLYEGYGANVAYSFPADIVKFLLYEQLKSYEKRGGHSISPLKAATLGAVSSSVAQILTTPLDVVRTRIMIQDSNQKDYLSVADALVKIGAEEGIGTLWAGTTPRIARSLFSGAIQFSSYELTKSFFIVK